MPLSTCNHAQSWWVSFGAVKELERFFFFFSFFFIFALEFFFYFSWSACSAGQLKICIEQPRCLKHTAWHFILQVSYKLFSFWPKQHHEWAQFPDAGRAGVPASIRKVEAETDRGIGALGDRKMKEKNFKRIAPARAPRRTSSRAPQSITKGPWPMPDVHRPGELWNGFVDADTKDGSSTYPTRSTVRHLPIIASERPRKRRTPWPSCAFNSTASSSETWKYPRSNGCQGPRIYFAYVLFQLALRRFVETRLQPLISGRDFITRREQITHFEARVLFDALVVGLRILAVNQASALSKEVESFRTSSFVLWPLTDLYLTAYWSHEEMQCRQLFAAKFLSKLGNRMHTSAANWGENFEHCQRWVFFEQCWTVSALTRPSWSELEFQCYWRKKWWSFGSAVNKKNKNKQKKDCSKKQRVRGSALSLKYARTTLQFRFERCHGSHVHVRSDKHSFQTSVFLLLLFFS